MRSVGAEARSPQPGGRTASPPATRLRMTGRSKHDEASSSLTTGSARLGSNRAASARVGPGSLDGRCAATRRAKATTRRERRKPRRACDVATRQGRPPPLGRGRGEALRRGQGRRQAPLPGSGLRRTPLGPAGRGPLLSETPAAAAPATDGCMPPRRGAQRNRRWRGLTPEHERSCGDDRRHAGRRERALGGELQALRVLEQVLSCAGQFHLDLCGPRF